MIRVYEIRRSRPCADELHTTWKINFDDRLTRRQMAIALLYARKRMTKRYQDWKETGVLEPLSPRVLEFDIYTGSVVIPCTGGGVINAQPQAE